MSPPSPISLRNSSRIRAGAQASQAAPDLKPGPVEVESIAPPNDSRLSVLLLDKTLLHVLAGPDQLYQLLHLPVASGQIGIPPRLDPPLQVFRLPPQIANRILKRPKQIGRPRHPLIRGNQSHV